MQTPHIILIDTHGAVIDYSVDTDTLSHVFTLLQTNGSRQNYPVIKPEYLTTEPETTVSQPGPKPRLGDIPPLAEGDGWRLYEGLSAEYVEIEWDEKPSLDVRNELKLHGFRWAAKSGRWYGKMTRIPAHYFCTPGMHTPKPDIKDEIPAFVEPPKAPDVRVATPTQDRPVPGQVIRLTGAQDEPSVARGDDWQDCVVEEPEKPSETGDAAFMASLSNLFKQN